MTGIILAGGKNNRMGYHKAFIEICGERVIDHVYHILKGITSDIIIVTNAPFLYQAFPVKIVTDLIPYQGPLGGIFTGLFYTSSFPALVLACDLPFITQGILKFLFSHWEESLDALIPLTPDGHQPLCALYGQKAMQVFQRYLEKGDLRLYQALKYLKKKYLSPEIIQTVDPQGKAFFNLNRPEDVEQAQKLCKKTHSNQTRRGI